MEKGEGGRLEEIILAKKGDTHIRLNCSRYTAAKKIRKIWKMDISKMDYDDDFNLTQKGGAK